MHRSAAYPQLGLLLAMVRCRGLEDPAVRCGAMLLGEQMRKPSNWGCRGCARSCSGGTTRRLPRALPGRVSCAACKTSASA
eukprot:8622489-Alexandrium_andersonii.AAC.1